MNKPSKHPFRILIVDDEPAIREMFSELLRSPNRSVDTRDTPRAALEFLEHDPVDLVIVDYALPGMTGTKLAEKIKQKCPQAHIVLCTGYCDDVAAEETGAANVERVLHKPVDLGEVLELADSYTTE